MNSKKAKQIRKMTSIRLEDDNSQFISKKDYHNLKHPTLKNDAALKVWKTMYKEAKRRYKGANLYMREQLGREWVEAI